MRARFRSISTRRKVEDNGFSFIELLAYMAIAALLILAAIPQFNQYREKAVISNMQSDARNLATSVEAYSTTNLDYPDAVVENTGNTSVTVGTGGDTQALTGNSETVVYAQKTGGYTITITSAKASGTTVVYDSTNGGLQPIGTSAPAAA